MFSAFNIKVMSSLQNVEIICGENKDNLNFEAIQNNPDYIFTNDPNFETIVLFDQEGNIINVNSWIECANYVNGGWSNNIYIENNFDFYLTIGLLIISTLFLYFKFKKKYV